MMDENIHEVGHSRGCRIWQAFAAVFLVVSVLFLVWGVYLKTELERAQKAADAGIRQDIISFGGDFVEVVLRTDGEVDFENRLKLENKVREIGDEEIFAAWQAFVESETEAEAQERVLDLLEMLFEKAKGA